MRASVASLSKKIISTLFAATLALGLMPAAAFAADEPTADETSTDIISSEVGEAADSNVISTDPLVIPSDSEESREADTTSSQDDQAWVIPAGQIINQTIPLETVAQQESTRSYFLAQTLESTKTIPVVSANLPLDTSAVDEVIEPDVESIASEEEEGDEDSDESDLTDDPVGARLELAPYESNSAVSAESTVIGSFTYNGITYAVEPGGETVAVVAADYTKLPEAFIEAQTIVVPSVATADGIDYYSVTRIADYAFANMPTEDDAITAVTIPASVTAIDQNAFNDFDTFQYIIVSEDNQSYSHYDGALYSADQTSLLLIPGGRLGAVRIAPNVMSIDPEAFSHCPSVDALVADADSAAFQLLSENDLYNSNNEKITISTEPPTEDTFDLAFYENLMQEEPNADNPGILSDLDNTQRVSAFAEGEDPEETPTYTLSLYRTTAMQRFSDINLATGEVVHLAGLAPNNDPVVIKNVVQWHATAGNATNGGVRMGYVDALTNQTHKIEASLLSDSSIYCIGWMVTYPATRDVQHYKNGGSSGMWRTEDAIVTPYFSNETYMINYVTNGGTPPWHTKNAASSTGAFSIGTAVRAHYFFEGWCSDAALQNVLPRNADGRSIGQINATGTTTFYAKWSPCVYQVNINLGSGGHWTNGTAFWQKYATGFYSNAAATSGYGASLSGTFSKTGYKFVGLNTKEDGSGTWVSQGNALQVQPTFFTAESTTVHAIWEPLERPVTLRGNDSEVSPASPHTQTTYAIYDQEMKPYPVNISQNGWDTESPKLAAPTREGYDFAGYWNTSYDEQSANATCYLVDDGTGSLKSSGATWNILDANQVLYAHWKYKIVFDLNVYGFTNTNGDAMQANVDWTGIPATGNGFSVVRPTEGAIFIEALYGAPVQLPKAVREGYADTRGWGLSSGSGGKASWVMRITPEGYSAKLNNGSLTAVAPEQATYLSNGGGASSYTFMPGIDDHTVTLYANWLWDDGVDPADSTDLGGGKKRYKVRLMASYDYTGLSFASDWSSQGELLENVEYDAVIPNSALASLSVPAPADATNEVGATVYKNLMFKGFYSAQNVPESANDIHGMQLIAPSADGKTLVGTSNLMRLVPPSESGEILLYALWALPKANVAFHLNATGLEAPVASYTAALNEPTSLVRVNGKVYTLPVETNQETPAITFAKPTKSPYKFNGWWTHPYKERNGSVQYYNENNQVVHDNWELFTDTVLYAHWTYDIAFNPKTGILGVGLTEKDNADGEYYDTSGNCYTFVNNEPGNGLEEIHAILGAPVYLPVASKPGYYPTTDWNVGPTTNNGQTVNNEGVPTKPSPIELDINGTATLTPNFEGKAHVFTVTLDAGANALKLDESEWENETVSNVTYDKAFPASTVGTPYRNGYTFQGFFTESGDKYVEANGVPVVDKSWKVDSLSDTVALFAQWAQDEYPVVFDVAHPNEVLSKARGTEEVKGGTALGTQTWTWGASYDSATLPAPEKGLTNPNALTASQFYRNGYDFDGWYWLEGVAQKRVDDPTVSSFMPSLAWQQQNKNKTLTLYAEWTPKTYAVVFDPNYQEKQSDVTYSYTVVYEQELTPYADAQSDAAVPADPPYTFVNWKADATGWILFDDDADANTLATTSGAFKPAWPLSTYDVGNPGATRTVAFTGQWKATEPVTVRLRAGDADRGAFDLSAAGMPDTFARDESTSAEIVFQNVGYGAEPFDLMAGACSPVVKDGYTLLGFVRTDANGNILDKTGAATLGKSPYDDYGNVRDEVENLLVGALSKLTADTYAVAVYAADGMSVTLDMSGMPHYDGYDSYELYDLIDGAYAKQDIPKTVYPFDVRTKPFYLPAEVAVPGYSFWGWYVRGCDPDTATKTVRVDPAVIANAAKDDDSLSQRTYVPKLVKATYRVSFDPNYGSAQGADAVKTATVDFEGKLQEQSADFPNVKKGATLPMAGVPSPKTTVLSDVYKSVPFSGWCVGKPDSDVLCNADATPAPSQWSAWIAEYADLNLGANETPELSVFALWNEDMISAVLPLYANVALDPDTARVAIVEAGYDIYGSGLPANTELEVASLKYQSVGANGSLGDNAFKMDDGHAYLTVFANAGKVPDMGEPSIDRAGLVNHAYGADSKTLKFNLNAAERTIGKADLETKYGFMPFSTNANPLKMHYGLSFNGVHIDAVRALRAKLPTINGKLQQNSTWTEASVPVARLLYTVQLAED